jgi:hypothetical protein
MTTSQAPVALSARVRAWLASLTLGQKIEGARQATLRAEIEVTLDRHFLDIVRLRDACGMLEIDVEDHSLRMFALEQRLLQIEVVLDVMLRAQIEADPQHPVNVLFKSLQHCGPNHAS